MRGLKAAQAAARRADLDQAIGDGGDSFGIAAAKVRALGDEIDRTRTRARHPVLPETDSRGLARYVALLRSARARQVEWVQSLRDSTVNVGPLSLKLRLLLPLMAALIPAVVSLGVAAVALGGSAAAAALGLGAMGVSAAALLTPMVALTAGVVARFQAQSEKAGTAAHSLAKAAGDASSAFQRMTAQGADRVMAGMADALRSIVPTMRALTPAFTNLGRVVGEQFSRIGEVFSSDRFTGFFRFITNAAAQAVPQLTTAFIGLSRVLANIAQAAMPFLQSGFRSLAGFMSDLAKRTSDIGALRAQIGGLVDHLKVWWGLAKNLGSAMVGLFKGMAPAGKELVRWLSEGAKKLSDWANSVEGQQRIREFMDQVIPLAKSIVDLLGKAAKAAIQFYELVAPIVKPIIDIFGKLLDVVNDLLGKLNDLPKPLGAIAAALGGAGIAKAAGGGGGLVGSILGALGGGALLRGVGKIGGALARRLGQALIFQIGPALKSVGMKVLSGLGGAFSKVAPAVGGALSKVLPIVGGFASKLGPLLLKAIPIVGLAATILQFKDEILTGLDFAWEGIKDGASAAADFVSNALSIGDGDFGGDLVRGATNLSARVQAALNGTVPAIERVYAQVREKLDLLARAPVSALAQAAPSIRDAANNFVAPLISGFSPALANATRFLAAGGVRLAHAFSARLNTAFLTGTRSAVRSIQQGLASALPAIRGPIQQVGNAVTNGLSSAIRQGGPKARAATTSVLNVARGAVQAATGNFRGAGLSLINAVASGQRAGSGRVRGASQQAGQSGISALRGLIGQYLGAGRQSGESYGQGVGSARGSVSSAAGSLIEAARSALSISDSFFSAGVSLVQGLANGIRSAIPAVAAAASAAASAARNMMPGSEPKDPRSPLRRLDKAGRAVLENFVSGMDPAIAARGMRGALSAADLATALSGTGGVRYGDSTTINPTMYVRSEGDAVGFLRRIELDRALHPS